MSSIKSKKIVLKALVLFFYSSVIIFSSVREGHVTKTYCRDVPLDHVVAGAAYILLVEKEKPFVC